MSRETSRVIRLGELREANFDHNDKWAVILLYDDFHSMGYVIWALLKIVRGLTEADTTLIMLEAHNTGKGVAAVCGREQADRYAESFRLLQLGCELESDW